MKKSLLTIILAVIIVTLSACGQQTGTQEAEPEASPAQEEPAVQEEPVTVKLGTWDVETSQQNFIKMAEGMDNVNLEIMAYPTSNEFWETLSTRVAAGTAPDFVIVSNDRISEYISRGIVEELDPGMMDLSGISEMAVEAWTFDGKLYGYPTELEANCLAINLNVWEEAGLTEDDFPTTWEEVAELSKIVTENCEDAYGFNFFVEDPFHISNLVNCFGGGWGMGNTIVSEENAEAIDWLIDLFNNGYACTPAQIGLTWDGEVIVANKAAMTIAGVWYAGTLRAANMEDQYAVVPLPAKNGGASCTHAGAFVMIKETKNYDATLKMMEYMSRPEAQQMRSDVVGLIPTALSIRGEYYKKFPEMLPLDGAEVGTRPFNYPTEIERFSSNLINALTAVFYSEEPSGVTGMQILEEVAKTGDYAS